MAWGAGLVAFSSTIAGALGRTLAAAVHRAAWAWGCLWYWPQALRVGRTVGRLVFELGGTGVAALR
jgi:hypothetical protein